MGNIGGRQLYQDGVGCSRNLCCFQQCFSHVAPEGCSDNDSTAQQYGNTIAQMHIGFSNDSLIITILM